MNNLPRLSWFQMPKHNKIFDFDWSCLIFDALFGSFENLLTPISWWCKRTIGNQQEYYHHIFVNFWYKKQISIKNFLLSILLLGIALINTHWKTWKDKRSPRQKGSILKRNLNVYVYWRFYLFLQQETPPKTFQIKQRKGKKWWFLIFFDGDGNLQNKRRKNQK